MGLDLSNLSVLGNSLSSLIPSSTDVVSNIAMGAATSVVLAGLKSQQGEDSIDPLHLFHDKPAANPNVVMGPTITAAAFAALPAASQAQLLAAGVHIV